MIEEQIYKIVDQTGAAIMTGRTNNPARRAKEYARYKWWKSEYKLEPYRTVARNGMSDEDYGMYAAAVEHMEICRNRTWDVQGGRNRMSPVCQMVWGPEARREVARMGGSIGGITAGRKAVESGHLASLRTPEHQGAAAKCAGRKALESGQLASVRSIEHSAKGGRKSGQISIANGHLKRIVALPQTIAAKKKLGRLRTENGFMERMRNLPQSKEAQRRGARISSHKNWHVRRAIANPDCELCKTSLLIAA